MTRAERLRLPRRAPALLVLVLGCTSTSNPAGGAAPATSQQAIVYGDDDRAEVFEHPDGALVAIARQAGVALMQHATLDFTGAPVVRVRAPPLGIAQPLCEDEPHLEQPAAARCSAVLVDDDLVLTAAHCLNLAECSRTFFAFDFLYDAPGELAALTREELYSCRRIAHRAESPPLDETRLDHAFVQLDRAVSSERAPVAVRPSGPMVPGEPVVSIGCSNGVPLKIADNAEVYDARPATLDSFVTNLDVFVGASGGPVLDERHLLAGVLSRGGDDYERSGECFRSRQLDDDSAGEHVSYAARAVAELCASGWPSERLCGIAPRCGDGVCSASEGPNRCPEDCAPPECGDLLCERSEWEACEQDCGDRRKPGVDPAWYCHGDWYDDGADCDCDCGAFDPDCGDPSDRLPCDSMGPRGEPADPGGIAGGGGGCAASGAGWWAVLGALCACRRERRARSNW